MIQTVIVILILAATLFFTVRWIVRTTRGKGGCGCGCSGCPYRGDCNKNEPPAGRRKSTTPDL